MKCDLSKINVRESVENENQNEVNFNIIIATDKIY